MLRPTIFKFDGSTYSDLSSYTKTDSTFDFISVSTDIIYIGLDRRFIGLLVDVGTAGSYTGLTIYSYDGDSWNQVEEIYNYDFNKDKYSMWNLPSEWPKVNFTDTFPHSSTPPDTVERHWIKISTSAVTTTATISKIRCIPYATYCSVKDVQRKLGLSEGDIFTSSSHPLTIFDVEEYIRESEGMIDFRTKDSWKLNVETEEEHEFNLTGIQLDHRNIYEVYNLYVWDGASYETKTQARSSDYFVNKLLGMVYFSRYFLLPARLAFVGPHWWGWGVGEFTYAIKVDYSYGRNWEKDKRFKIISDITSKMAAIKVLESTNYLALIPEGIRGGIDLETKVERWKLEIDEDLSNLTPMVVV